jgi:hypothetical protein
MGKLPLVKIKSYQWHFLGMNPEKYPLNRYSRILQSFFAPILMWIEAGNSEPGNIYQGIH